MRASYRYIADHPEIDDLLMIIRNVNNRDTTRLIYYDDGLEVDFDWELGCESLYTCLNVANFIKNELAEDERNVVRDSASHSMQITIVSDKAGDAIELEFLIWCTDLVFARMSPDRLYM